MVTSPFRFSDVFGTYRESGNSGYDVKSTAKETAKYYGACVADYNGTKENCTMKVGGYYIQCHDECALEKCADPDSQKDCTAFVEDKDRAECESSIKWCKKYTREKVPQGKDRGFIPRTYHCINAKGHFSQTKGEILKDSSGTLGNCSYGDGITAVDRVISRDYEYCGGDGQVCNSTFLGGYRSKNYDPRWRGWYETTKAQQKYLWSEPYTFFSSSKMGITYSEPIYSTEDEKIIFKGVLAVDYSFDGITSFLQNAYEKTAAVSVVICEDAQPNYIIGSSTGRKATRKVLSSNNTKPCPDGTIDNCESIRVRISELAGISGENKMDAILAIAFAKHKNAGFPNTMLTSSGSTDGIGSDAYIFLSRIYEQPNTNLKWRIIITTPMDKADGDSFLPGSASFKMLIFCGALGFITCATLLGLIYHNRGERVVIQSDWRFTSTFMLACTLMNISIFSYLGPNSDATCMLRMWLFHFLFVLVLAPLFVKVWRMYKLVGEETTRSLRRITITHKRAALYTLLIIVPQVIILTFFSIVDPSKQTEVIKMIDNVNLQHTLCAQDTPAFIIVEFIYEGGLVVVGCILAYMTRNVNSVYGESKQLIFTMSNIAFIGLVTVVTGVSLKTSTQVMRYSLQALLIFWVTVISCCVFAIPRLIQIGRETQ